MWDSSQEGKVTINCTRMLQNTCSAAPGTGELLFPLGEALWKEQVPTPPWPSRYLRLQGTLQEIQERGRGWELKLDELSEVDEIMTL